MEHYCVGERAISGRESWVMGAIGSFNMDAVDGSIAAAKRPTSYVLRKVP